MQWQVHGQRALYERDWVNLWLEDLEIEDGKRVQHHVMPMPRQSVAVSQAVLSIDAVRAWSVSDLVLAATLVGAALTLVPLEASAGLTTAYGIGYVATCVVLALRLRGAADADVART